MNLAPEPGLELGTLASAFGTITTIPLDHVPQLKPNPLPNVPRELVSQLINGFFLFTSVPFVAIILISFDKNGRANAVLSAIFYVLHPAKLRQMPSSTIFVANYLRSKIATNINFH